MHTSIFLGVILLIKNFIFLGAKFGKPKNLVMASTMSLKIDLLMPNTSKKS